MSAFVVTLAAGHWSFVTQLRSSGRVKSRRGFCTVLMAIVKCVW